MNHQEEALTFPCDGERLFGILARPEEPTDVGVVIVVGGPQTRVGSHRQFLLLSRQLAREGFATLRFDYRGMGDSGGTQRTFETVSNDIDAAITSLRDACPEIRRIVLWGLCDAASAALMYWKHTRDSRIAGLCLLNPWVRSEATLARTRVKHYYGQRLLQGAFWKKLLRGEVELGKTVASLAGNLRHTLAAKTAQDSGGQQSFQEMMAEACAQFPGPIRIILSGNDHTAQEFLEYAATSRPLGAALKRPNVSRCDVPEADHTFSSGPWRHEVEQLTLAWLHTL